jgi:hypothetical protein
MKSAVCTTFLDNIKIIYDNQSKEDEMDGACGAHGGGEGCIQHFGWEA